MFRLSGLNFRTLFIVGGGGGLRVLVVLSVWVMLLVLVWWVFVFRFVASVVAARVSVCSLVLLVWKLVMAWLRCCMVDAVFLSAQMFDTIFVFWLGMFLFV